MGSFNRLYSRSIVTDFSVSFINSKFVLMKSRFTVAKLLHNLFLLPFQNSFQFSKRYHYLTISRSSRPPASRFRLSAPVSAVGAEMRLRQQSCSVASPRVPIRSPGCLHLQFACCTRENPQTRYVESAGIRFTPLLFIKATTMESLEGKIFFSSFGFFPSR